MKILPKKAVSLIITEEAKKKSDARRYRKESRRMVQGDAEHTETDPFGADALNAVRASASRRYRVIEGLKFQELRWYRASMRP